MTDDERAVTGAERRMQRRSQPAGVPVVYAPPSNSDTFDDEDEITAPESILAREVTDVDLEILHRMGISANATVTFADFVKFLNRNNKREEKSKSGNQELGRQMEELRQLLAKPPNGAVTELQDQVAALQAEADKFRGTVKWLRGVAVAALVAALGSVGTFAVKIWDRAKDEGEAIIRLEYVERDVKQLRQDIRDERAHYPQNKE